MQPSAEEPRSGSRCPENAEVAAALDEIAGLLEAQAANEFRVGAYRRAANTLRELTLPVVDLFAQRGINGLEELPGIGVSLASLLREYARSGRISLLERLRGSVSAEELLAAVPGLGTVLAHRIHEELGIETLEELECACHDGRLAALPGFGPRRLAAVRASLAAMLSRSARPHSADARRERPSVAALLAVDREYRAAAEANRLPRIAPKRFNPQRRAWLPILHVEREGWALTALFSNSARAHRLGHTRDWVVIFADRDGDHDQCTVVWEGRGDERRRVVRGRELECGTVAAEP